MSVNFDKHRYILEAIENLRMAHSWTGRTHVQKTLYLVKETVIRNLPFEYVLYRHGPYSFDVDRELEEMLSYEAISLMSKGEYGPTLFPGSGAVIVTRESNMQEDQLQGIDEIASFVGDRDVIKLEALATAMWIRCREAIGDNSGVLQRLSELKPHLEDAVASKGVEDSGVLMKKYRS